MASHALFQYNVLAIDDTHNTWTIVIVKMTILRLLGSSDDKEKRGVARPEGPPLRGFQGSALKALRSKGQELRHFALAEEDREKYLRRCIGRRRPKKIPTPVEPTIHRSIASVQLSREVVFGGT